MKENYTIIYDEEPISIEEIRGDLPKEYLYPLSLSDSSHLYQFQSGSLLRQKSNFEYYEIDTFELITNKPFRIKYELFEKRVFITFVIENDINFTIGAEHPMLLAKELTHYLSSEDKGIYGVNCRPGRTVLGVVSVQPDWLLKTINGYPLLTEAVRRMLETDSPFELLPVFKIDKKLRTWIFQVRNFSHENRIARDSYVATHLAMALSNYEKSLAQTDSGKIYQIKLYIEQEFADPHLSLRQIIDTYGFSERTAMRKFKAIYGMSMRTFKTNVRIIAGLALIQKEGIPVTQLIEKVGYLNANSFHKASRKFLAKK